MNASMETFDENMFEDVESTDDWVNHSYHQFLKEMILSLNKKVQNNQFTQLFRGKFMEQF